MLTEQVTEAEEKNGGNLSALNEDNLRRQQKLKQVPMHKLSLVSPLLFFTGITCYNWLCKLTQEANKSHFQCADHLQNIASLTLHSKKMFGQKLHEICINLMFIATFHKTEIALSPTAYYCTYFVPVFQRITIYLRG